jgi:long-chain acyl-CoA synthetase
LDLPKETEEAFTKDGWFKTGDIGEFDARGNLRIIDRKKNLVKTLNGEYIALEKLESIYRTCAVVQNICVYAAADKNKPIAIVSVVEKVLQQIAKDNGVEKGGDALLQDPKVNKAVLKEMQAAGKSAGFAPFEILEGVALTDDEWTPQSVSTVQSHNDGTHTNFDNRTWSRPRRSLTARLSTTLTRTRSRRHIAAARHLFHKITILAFSSSPSE